MNRNFVERKKDDIISSQVGTKIKDGKISSFVLGRNKRRRDVISRMPSSVINSNKDKYNKAKIKLFGSKPTGKKDLLNEKLQDKLLRRRHFKYPSNSNYPGLGRF